MGRVTQANRLRFRMMVISRQVKAMFIAPPEHMAKAIVGRWFLGFVLRWLFLGPDEKPHRAGEIVLAELRRRAGMDRYSIFDPDPQVMAYREGQRAIVMEIFNLLNLDESDVRNMMELDDGLE